MYLPYWKSYKLKKSIMPTILSNKYCKYHYNMQLIFVIDYKNFLNIKLAYSFQIEILMFQYL